MNGAAPRSHFCGTPLEKYQLHSCFVNSLEELTPLPAIAGNLSHCTVKLVNNGPATRCLLARKQDLARPDLTNLADYDRIYLKCHDSFVKDSRSTAGLTEPSCQKRQ